MPITRSPSTDCIASVTMPAGLVKLMTHASGREPTGALGDVEGHRHGAQPVGQPAGADGLLARARPRRGRLARRRVRPARPPTRIAEKTKSAPRKRRVEVGRWSAPRGGRCARRRPARQHRATAASRAGIHVVQHDLGDPAGGVVAQQGPVDQRHPEAAAAENRQPHPSTTSTPAARHCCEDRRVGVVVGHQDVDVLADRRPACARAGELVPSATSDHLAAPPRSWPA